MKIKKIKLNISVINPLLNKHFGITNTADWNYLMGALDQLEDEGYTTSLKTNYIRINPKHGDYSDEILRVFLNMGGCTCQVDDERCDYIQFTFDEPLIKARMVLTALIIFSYLEENKFI